MRLEDGVWRCPMFVVMCGVSTRCCCCCCCDDDVVIVAFKLAIRMKKNYGLSYLYNNNNNSNNNSSSSRRNATDE